MTIARIEPIPVAYPEPNDHDATRHLCLVRITDGDGRVGWGEAVTMWPEASRATAAIIDGLAELLIGRQAIEGERLWREMKEHAWWYGLGGIASFAIAALDIALWDLRGKTVSLPVVDLLGGAVHERLPCIASSHATHAEIPAMAEEIAGWLSTGLQGAKVGFGKRGDAHLGFEHDRDVEFVRQVRAAIGADAMLMVDIGNRIRWDVTTAVERTRAMEEHGLTWIEEPLGHDDPAGYATLRAKTTTRIAYGEREWNLAGLTRILDTGTVDVIGIDPGRAEGITGFAKACALIEQRRGWANAHTWSSAIVTAASLAVSFSSPACRLFEVKPLRNPMQHELTPTPFEHHDGWALPPTGAGLGIEIDEDVVARYRLDG